MDSLKKIEAHHFSDASTEGYGQCSYLCLLSTRQCSLVMGKALVTPLKLIIIPRLDLTATLVSIRLSDMLGQEFRHDELEEMFWTDSKVVQVYTQNDPRCFHTSQMKEHTVPEQWYYVDGKNSSADDTSCGLSPKDLLQSS